MIHDTPIRYKILRFTIQNAIQLLCMIVLIEVSVVAKSEFVSEFATQSHLSSKAWFWSSRPIIPRPSKCFGRVTFFHGSRQ
jgi:hypothetical protein